MLVYAVVVISTMRITGDWLKKEEPENNGITVAVVSKGECMSREMGRSGKDSLRIGICLLAVPFLLFNTLVTSSTSWAGCPGFTPFKLAGKGYYNHRYQTRKLGKKRL